jgi:branched-chain amino acid transport system ATP-binding protein
MLEIVDLRAGYNRIDVLRSVSITVEQGAFVGLLGPNGAGKTTLMRSISGLARVHGGDIRFEGRSLRNMTPEMIVDIGIVHVPQGRMLFPESTIKENLQLGAYRRAARGGYSEKLKHVERYFPILKERVNQVAGVLSGGEQQMLAIGRALMAQPRLLILDEPSLGLAPRIIDEIFEVMRRINQDDGVTILVAEQNAMKVLQSVERAYVLESGVIAHQGKASELIRNEQVKSSYLGVA